MKLPFSISTTGMCFAHFLSMFRKFFLQVPAQATYSPLSGLCSDVTVLVRPTLITLCKVTPSHCPAPVWLFSFLHPDCILRCFLLLTYFNCVLSVFPYPYWNRCPMKVGSYFVFWHILSTKNNTNL